MLSLVEGNVYILPFEDSGSSYSFGTSLIQDLGGSNSSPVPILWVAAFMKDLTKRDTVVVFPKPVGLRTHYHQKVLKTPRDFDVLLGVLST